MFCVPLFMVLVECMAVPKRVIEPRGPMEDTIFPIPLRDGTITVRIQGLPFDLTLDEANKIVAVVLAYAGGEHA